MPCAAAARLVAPAPRTHLPLPLPPWLPQGPAERGAEPGQQAARRAGGAERRPHAGAAGEGRAAGGQPGAAAGGRRGGACSCRAGPGNKQRRSRRRACSALLLALPGTGFSPGPGPPPRRLRRAPSWRRSRTRRPTSGGRRSWRCAWLDGLRGRLGAGSGLQQAAVHAPEAAAVAALLPCAGRAVGGCRRQGAGGRGLCRLAGGPCMLHLPLAWVPAACGGGAAAKSRAHPLDHPLLHCSIPPGCSMRLRWLPLDPALPVHSPSLPPSLPLHSPSLPAPIIAP